MSRETRLERSEQRGELFVSGFLNDDNDNIIGSIWKDAHACLREHNHNYNELPANLIKTTMEHCMA
jgi:hypothetical protein